MFYKKFCIAVSAIAVSAVAAAAAAEYHFLPDEINITKGSKSSISLNLPLYAEIENAPAMVVNNKPVSGNINISLLNPVSIKIDDETSISTKISLMGITIKNIRLNVKPRTYVIPSGKTVGIRLDTSGVMVLGTGEVEDDNGIFSEPAKNVLKSGDLIINVNGEKTESNEALQTAIKKSSGVIKLDIIRGGNNINASVTPVKSNNENKIGVWVRDSTQGIGTVTFTDPKRGTFAALGHPVTDVDTKKIMPAKTGIITNADVKSAVAGVKGTPGELSGDMDYSSEFGTITINSETGIHGILNENGKKEFVGNSMPIAERNDVKAGEAYILSTVEGSRPKKYTINIDSINKYTTDNTKNMTITVTDKELLNKTGGIIQGMSGSPIIQNNMVVGAVTHVFVQQPEKGYAIFAENMYQ